MEAPINVTYGQIKSMLDVGGYENLPDTQVYDLILLIPCYIMGLRDNVLESFHEYKVAESSYNMEYAKAFLAAEGSVEVKKMQASISENVVNAKQCLNEADGEYEKIRHAPDDWIELQNALKRICDVKFRKAGVQ